MINITDYQAVAEQAAAQWADVTSPPRLVVQRENIVFRLETLQGPHALRLHRRGYHREAVIKSELLWMDMLARHHFAVPTPKKAMSGEFIVRAYDSLGDEHMCSLLAWLPGEQFGKSAQPLMVQGSRRTLLMAAIGRKLARMHLLSDAWARPSDFERPRWDFDGLLGENPFWGKFWAATFLTQDEREILENVRSKCIVALRVYEASGADRGLIHADLARENILVDGDTVNFIDYDDSGFGYRLFDIATALIKNIHEPDYVDLRKALLDGYREVRALQQKHLDVLPLMMLLRSLTYLGWVDERIHEPEMPAKAIRFLADVKIFSRLL